MANDIADLLLRIDATTEGLRRELKRAEDAVDGNATNIDRSTKKIDQSFEEMKATAIRVGLAIAAAFGIREIIAYGDAWQSASNQLKTVQRDSEDLTATQQRLLAVANESYAGYEATAGLYTRLSRATEALNLTQEETIDLTNTINQSFAVSGATAQEASNAITQLAQGLSAGALRGDEFNSVAEQSPILMQAIADSLNMTRGELRAFAAEGGITSEIVVNALQQASAEIDQTFRSMSATFGQNMQVAKNNMLEFVGNNSAVTYSLSLVGGAIALASENLDVLSTALMAVGAAFAVYAVPTGILAGLALIKTAVLALNTAVLANPWAAAAMAVAAAAVVIYQYWDEIVVAAQRAAINIEIAWNGLKLFFLESFSPALSAIAGMFDEIKYRALATWAGISAAATDPFSAIETFNGAFDETIIRLRAGDQGAQVFSGAIAETKTRIGVLENELHEMNQTAAVAEIVIEDTAYAMEGLSDETGTAVVETADLTNKLDDQITKLRQQQAALALGAREQAIYNAVINLGTDATSAQVNEIARLTGELYDQKTATTAAATEAKRLEDANTRAAQESQRAWERTHSYLSDTFVDIMNNGKDAFSQIWEAFRTMIQRMIAEWAASGLMNLLGMSGGSATASNPLTQIMGLFSGGGGGGGGGGGVSAGSAGNLLSAGASIAGSIGGFISGMTGTATGIAAGTVGPPTAAAMAGAGVGGTLSAAGSAVMSGLSSAGSAVMSALGSIPGWGWALGAAALAAKYLDNGGTYSANAGLLIHDAPGAAADRKFAVDPFESGFAPIGFARREDQATASGVIDAFRAYDAMLTRIARASGLNVNFSNNPFGGYDENSQGNGLFLGVSKEDGKDRGAGLTEQLDRFVGQWIDALGGQLSPEERAMIKAAGSADDMVKMAAKIAGIDGSHAAGLSSVPFDGYRAELHKNEEVLTANDPRNQNNGGGMMGEMRDMLAEMRNMAYYTKRTADLLIRVTRDGDSLVTVAA